jgi:uncharacterized protein YjcR
LAKPIEHSESQIEEILGAARRYPIKEVASKYQVSEAAIHAWHAKFGESPAREIKRLRHLRLDHARRRRF